MDFSWSTEQQQLRDAVIDMARKELNHDLVELDNAGGFNRRGWRQCAEFGVHGLPMPEEYGGQGLDPLTTVGVLESLGYGCKDNGLIFSINAQMWTCQMPLLAFGNEEQKRRYLPGLCSGDLIGGNAMTEPDSGTDAFALTTKAVRSAKGYRLNGKKVFITNGPVADVLVVFATLDPSQGRSALCAFLVERDFPGFSCVESSGKMGMRTSPMAELFFDDCEVPLENCLGEEGSGSSIFTHSMTWERTCILASAVGSMQRLLETCIDYAQERQQFGEAIGKFQLVASKIVDMKLRLETSRALLYQAAWKRGLGRASYLEASLAKLQISESWVECAQHAIQIHGGYGYMRGYEVERELRDAIGSRIYSGTSEIQRTIAASLLGL